MPFHTPLHVARDGDKWILTAPLIYQSAVAGQTFAIPAGFKTDFASVPRVPLAYWLAGDTAHGPAVVHDWLYVTRTVPRKVADAVFREAMEADGVPWWRRSIMWASVRMFGGMVREDQPEVAN